MASEDCKYWNDDIGLCSITGSDYCTRKCKDYIPYEYYDYEDEF